MRFWRDIFFVIHKAVISTFFNYLISIDLSSTIFHYFLSTTMFSYMICIFHIIQTQNWQQRNAELAATATTTTTCKCIITWGCQHRQWSHLLNLRDNNMQMHHYMRLSATEMELPPEPARQGPERWSRSEFSNTWSAWMSEATSGVSSHS